MTENERAYILDILSDAWQAYDEVCTELMKVQNQIKKDKWESNPYKIASNLVEAQYQLTEGDWRLQKARQKLREVKVTEQFDGSTEV